MAATDLLNADMATLGRLVRDGFDWWRGELVGLVPPGLGRALGGAAETVAELSPEGRHTLYRGGRAVAGAGGRAAVALPRGAVLERTLVLPMLSMRDTRALVALDIDRLTPFAAADIVFDLEPVTRDPVAGRQTLLLAILPRTTGLAALAQARAGGIEPIALGQSLAPGSGELRHDFLAALEADARPWWARRGYWWGAVGLMLALNVGVAIWRDVRQTDAMAELVAAQSDGVALAQRLRGRVAAEDARRAALVARRGANDPLPLLAAATAALPPPAWVQRAQWDGKSLRLTGFAPGIDPVAALRRSPALGPVRAASADLAPDTAAGTPFDLAVTPPR